MLTIWLYFGAFIGLLPSATARLLDVCDLRWICVWINRIVGYGFWAAKGSFCEICRLALWITDPFRFGKANASLRRRFIGFGALACILMAFRLLAWRWFAVIFVYFGLSIGLGGTRFYFSAGISRLGRRFNVLGRFCRFAWYGSILIIISTLEQKLSETVAHICCTEALMLHKPIW